MVQGDFPSPLGSGFTPEAKTFDELSQTAMESATSEALTHIRARPESDGASLKGKKIVKSHEKPFIFHTKAQNLLIGYEGKNKNSFSQESIKTLTSLIQGKFREWDAFFGDTSYAVILPKALTHTSSDVILVKSESGRQRAYFMVEEIGKGTFKTGFKLLSTSSKMQKMIAVPNYVLTNKAPETPAVDAQKETLLQGPKGPLHGLKHVAKVQRFVDLRQTAQSDPKAVTLGEGIPGTMARFYSGGNLQDGKSVLGEGDKHLAKSVFYSLMATAATGLNVAHKNHITHRDIKPGNIVQEDGKAYIIDWGSAAYFKDLSTLKECGLKEDSELYREFASHQEGVRAEGSTNTFIPPDVFGIYFDLASSGKAEFSWLEGVKSKVESLQQAKVAHLLQEADKTGRSLTDADAQKIAKREVLEIQSQKWDVYALGATAYQKATGSLPPRAQRVHSSRISHIPGAKMTQELHAQDIETMRATLQEAKIAKDVIDLIIKTQEPNPFDRPSMKTFKHTFQHHVK